MVLQIMFGRRIHRNSDKKWFARQVGKMKQTLSIQQYLWSNIEYGLKLACIKMDKSIKKRNDIGDYSFNYSKIKYKENESLNYDIEWIKLTINGSYEEEMEEYHQTMKSFDTLQNSRIFKQNTKNIELNDEELSQDYEHKIRGKKAQSLLQKGYDRVKDMTIVKTLNDVGIIVSVEPPKKADTIENDNT